ncbi:hypothetical protein KM043_017560 [Ampulex compressa]|nr:hypothetical protein KM043_017560 [Ampulex compressa]
MRRARIKAMVTVPARRKTVQDLSTTESDKSLENANRNKDVLDEKSMPKNSDNKVAQEKEIQENVTIIFESQSEESQEKESNIDGDDKFEQSCNDMELKSVLSPDITSTSQTALPVKVTQNRMCFMRPTPRLDNGGRVRRNSVQGSGASASELEDDNRRVNFTNTNRMRSDSLCSVQSNKESNANVSQSNLTIFKNGQKRRMLVSESARKLAEARREFLMKHENKAPDRSKLTMYDLIYYNPISNPMKSSRDTITVTRTVSFSQSDGMQEEEEENEDDPSAMPVPQVKVGPDGQLIIDEQSLVIEQTNAKRNREVLAKEVIVDNDNTGSGFYKRRQKSKDWPKWETLKFYKALNTVGTDFLLMQSLFPNRTRQEIKLKFKKEERINRNLVEKALAYHQEFDTDILEKEIATFMDLEKEQTKTHGKQRQQDVKLGKKVKSGRKRTCRIVASSIGEMDASDNEEEEKMEISMQRQNTDDVPEEDERITDCTNALDNVTVNTATHYTETIKTVIPDIGHVEPGSLVILSKESSEEPGKSVLQVYMVSSNLESSKDQIKPDITPLNLSPELLATVTTKLSNIDSIGIKEEQE